MATQFSVLSHRICTNAFFCFLVISLRLSSGHRLWRLSSCCSGTASGDPCHFIVQISSHHFSGRRLWRLSFLSCHRKLMKFGHRQWRPFLHTYMQTYTHIPFHFLASHSILIFSLPFWFEIHMCEGAPTNPDSLCLQHVVDFVWSGSGQTG